MKRIVCKVAIVAKRSLSVLAGLVLAATIDIASASASTSSINAAAPLGAPQSVRLAEVTTAAKRGHVEKSTKPHYALRTPGETWLNPQHEPPMAPT